MTVTGLHVATGSIAIAVNNRTYVGGILETDPFSPYVSQALRNGHDPAFAMRFLAEIGAHIFHPSRAKHRDITERWESFFGEPRSIPQGSILGRITITAHGRKFIAEVHNNDQYHTQLLRAHERNKNVVSAFKFLAEIGSTELTKDHPMLGGRQNTECERIFRGLLPSMQIY